MDPYFFGFFTVVYMLIFIWGVVKQRKTASAILFLVIIALIYDNAILALGHVIGEGRLLKNLNYGRYWLHALLTPTLILFSLYIMREAKIKGVQKGWISYVFGTLWIVAIVVEYVFELNGLTLSLQESYGALTYASSQKASGPPPMILIVIITLIIAAVTLAWKRKWWWMLIGTSIMAIGSAVLIDVKSNAITNAMELFLVATLMLTAIHFSREVKGSK